jgi:hypothetical protein
MEINTQYIYGYRLSHEDGSVGDWSFIDDNTLVFTVYIILTNKAVYKYNSRDGQSLERWAKDRELKLETCVFEFDPKAMTFTKVPESK